MNEIQLTDSLPDADLAALEGRHVDDRHFDVVVRETTTVRKPDGSVLLVYVKDVLPRAACSIAWETFRDVRGKTERGMAMGRADAGAVPGSVVIGRGIRLRRRRADGTLSKPFSPKLAPSADVGYLDPFFKIPFCRLTQFNMDHHAEFERARPVLVRASDTFQEHVPDRGAAQVGFLKDVSADFKIRGTAFTTVTVNQTFRTKLHKDRHDFTAGFGVLSVLEAGHYEGGELIFPKYRVAVDLRTGGLLLCDVHEFHGNNVIRGTPGAFRRLSLVMYAREHITQCGTLAEETAKAKAIKTRVNT